MIRAFITVIVGSVAITNVSCNRNFSFDVQGAIGGGSGGSNATDSGATEADADADVECNSRCAIWNQVCATDWHVCAECNYDADCQAIGKKRCWAEDHRCVDCATDLDCVAGQEHCVSQTGECRKACSYGADDDGCGSDFERCSDSNICVECDRDAQCSSTGRGKRCLPGSGYCVECVSDADCTGGLKCDTVMHGCVECKDGRDCANGCCNFAMHQCF